MRTLRSWQLPGGPIESTADLLARCGYRLAPSTDSAPTKDARSAAPTEDEDVIDPEDVCLAALIGLAAHQPLAARVVLQRIVPPLLGLANRKGRSPSHRDQLFDDLVANAWMVILAYPAVRRPRRIAAGLVRDVSFQTFV
ncbi:MAG TPA: hypothetical protein PLV68_19355, partial [Ilumatobacteraceae bacterium]|nr:hypothetical protein [Ilumatobacteraceae bacterium]